MATGRSSHSHFGCGRPLPEGNVLGMGMGKDGQKGT